MYSIKIDIKKINKLPYDISRRLKEHIGSEVCSLMNGHEEITVEREIIVGPEYYKIVNKRGLIWD